MFMGGPASAQLYTTGSLGLFAPNDNTATGGGFSGTAQLDNGIFAGAALGFRYSPHLRAEAEFAYAHSRFNKLTVAGVGSANVAGGDVDLYTFTANGYYDFTTGTIYTPYLGGGLGLVHTETGAGSVAGVTFGGGSSNDFVWQLEAGVSVAVANNLSIVPAYRYRHIDNGGMLSGIKTDDSEGHIFKVGLRYSF